MSKLAFLASFLASFVMMDAQLFHGETTQAAWQGAMDAMRAAQTWTEQSTTPH
jgi:hypothetical protein